MIHRDPKCVFVANSVGEATVIANWLEAHEISARVMDAMTHGGLDGLTAWTGVSARGIEVWVQQPDDVSTALKLIAQHDAAQSSGEGEGGSQSQPVLGFCDVCGATSEFPGEQYGTTQSCPQCGDSLHVAEADDAETDDDDGAPSTLGYMSSLKDLQKPIILFGLGCFGTYVFALFLMAFLSWLRAR
jgi:hypothetical protein